MTSTRGKLASWKWLAMEESKQRCRRTCGMRFFQYLLCSDMIFDLARFFLCSTNTSSNSSRFTCTSASLTRWLKRSNKEIISLHVQQVLCALEVAGHYDTIGKQLMQYITLFFPRHIKRFRAQRYADRVGNDNMVG